jgi:FtsP/CotA-like multicopper oxidase with cupredoxin domain
VSPLSRRGLLRGLGAAAALVVLPAGGLTAYTWVSTTRSNVGRVRFERRLAIPPLLEGERTGERVAFGLELQTGSSELLPGRRTPTWGANGTHLGPTIRLRRGDAVTARVRNGLPEATSLHWHGMELPAVADGGPHSMIAAGAEWLPSWRVDQPAATLWYHPHPHGSTKDHVYRGIVGMLLVDDGAAADLLPRTYGVDDIPVILQDVNLAEDGSLDTTGIAYGGLDIVGLLGSEILVNGTWGPVLRVVTERVRLRVLNASNSRVYDLVLDDGRPFHVVAGDSGLLPAPVVLDHLLLSPGERAEIVVGVRPGERLLLRSRPPDLQGSVFYDRITDHLAGGDDTFELLRLDAAALLAPSPPLPAALPAAEPVPATGRVRRLELGDFTINGQIFAMDRVDMVVPIGGPELWRVLNGQGVPHNLHIHNASFTVVDVDGGPPPPELRGRKDTVFMPPGSEVGLAVSFGQHPDPTVPYMFHCHLLAHEDAGMMGQFVVVEPGTEDQVRIRPSAHDGPH